MPQRREQGQVGVGPTWTSPAIWLSTIGRNTGNTGNTATLYSIPN